MTFTTRPQYGEGRAGKCEMYCSEDWVVAETAMVRAHYR